MNNKCCTCREPADFALWVPYTVPSFWPRRRERVWYCLKHAEQTMRSYKTGIVEIDWAAIKGKEWVEKAEKLARKIILENRGFSLTFAEDVV